MIRKRYGLITKSKAGEMRKVIWRAVVCRCVCCLERKVQGEYKSWFWATSVFISCLWRKGGREEGRSSSSRWSREEGDVVRMLW